MNNLIIDCGNLLHRTYHSAKNKPYKNSKDKNVGHVIQFFQQVKSFVEKFKPDSIYAAWDIRDSKFVNFRHELVEYKGHRDRSEHEEIHQFDKILWFMLESLGVTCLRANKLEADDIISWLCCDFLPKEDQKVIISSDQDFIQLLGYNINVKIFSPIKNLEITESNYLNSTNGVDIKKFVVYKAIVGDSSDNVKGLYKYGPVKAKKFVESFKEKYDKLDESQQQTIKENIKIMDLRIGLKTYPDEKDYYQEQIKNNECNVSNFIKVCEKLELDPLLWNKSEWGDLFNGGNIKKQLKLLSFL